MTDNITIPEAASDIVEQVSKNASVSQDYLENLWHSFLDYIPTLIVALILFVIGFFLNKLVMKLLCKGLEKSKLDKTIHSFLRSLVKIVLYSLVIVIVLTILGIPMTSIIAVIGSAGIAIGLAMQSSLSNLAGGVIVLMGKQFKVGDYILVGDKEGTVNDITIFFTKIVTYDNKAIYIPNGIVSSSTITNFTQEAVRRISTVIGVHYEVDVKKAEAVLLDMAKRNPLVLNSPEPKAHIKAFSASSIDIELWTWVQSSDYWTVYFNLMEEIKEAFDANDISFPYDQLDVHIIDQKQK